MKFRHSWRTQRNLGIQHIFRLYSKYCQKQHCCYHTFHRPEDKISLDQTGNNTYPIDMHTDEMKDTQMDLRKKRTSANGGKEGLKPFSGTQVNGANFILFVVAEKVSLGNVFSTVT